MRYLLTGDEFDADTALRLGLVQEIVDPGQQLDRAFSLAERIAGQAPLAVAETLRSARTAVFAGWPAAVAEFGTAQWRLMLSEDGREGVHSIRGKRDGVFRGR